MCSSLENQLLDFSLKLLDQLSSEDNLVFSPVSLSSCLSMVLMGTRSTCAEQLSNCLFGKTIKDNEYELMAKELKSIFDKSLKSNSSALSSANFMYSHSEFKVLPKFKELVEKYFSAKSRELDFFNQKKESIDSINCDIRRATNGKIDQLLEDLDDSTVMVLANALYFKGLWRSKFDKENTQSDKFTTNSKQEISVQMMFQTKKIPFGYSQALKARAIEMSYDNSNAVMIFLLPDENSSLSELRSGLTIEALNQMVKSLSSVKVDVYLPKFKSESSLELIPKLRAIGIKDIFAVQSADFSGLSDQKGLYVSQVIQKAVIEVNEDGTEAAAATAVGITLMCMQYNEEFRANRPFMYFLVTKNESKSINSILFLGECNKPKA